MGKPSWSKQVWQEQLSGLNLPLQGVVYLVESDRNNVEDPMPQECQGFLALIQVLLEQDLTPHLYLVTRNAQTVTNQEQPTLVGMRQACLWGMQKAIALEYPELPWCAIDLPEDLSKIGSQQDAHYIYRELIQQSQEQVAIRNQKRYVARLQRYSLETPQANKQLVINQQGNLDSLEWQGTERAQPQPGQIEIAVKATGLNFRDVTVALGLYPDKAQFLGLECAGEITAIGEGVSGFKLGDRVIAIAASSFSNYVITEAALAVLKPDNLSYSEAVTIPVTFLTAYHTLVNQAKLQPGESILIHSAAGGVGLAAVAIAQQIGAEIYATASPSKWSLLQTKGVKNIFNSRTLDFAEEILSLTEEKGMDVVLNSFNGEYISKSLEVLADKGRFIEIGKQGIWTQEQVREHKPNCDYAIVDLWQITQEQPELIQTMLCELTTKFAQSQLSSLTLVQFPQSRVTDAFRFMQQGKHQGKIVITQNNPVREYRDTYLITGGLGAIGLEVAHWLADRGVKHLVLVGRHPVKPDQKTSLEKLQNSCGVTVIYADVCDRNQLTQVFKQLENLPPLRGIIHCAGALDDGVILQQTWQKFQNVLSAKVQGAWNLHLLTQKYDLDRFILFSSAASLLGSKAQANYAAANAFLDGLANMRKLKGFPALALNWTAWKNTGLAVTDRLTYIDINPIDQQDAINLLDDLFQQDVAQIGTLPVNWQQWQKNNKLSPFYQDLSDRQIQTPKLSSNLEQLQNSSQATRKQILITQVVREVAKILGLNNLEDLELDLGFSELGLDSLAAVELRNKLQSIYEVKLSASVIFNYPTIEEISVRLLALLFPLETQGSIKQTTLEQNNLQDISEEVAEELLLAELSNLDLDNI